MLTGGQWAEGVFHQTDDETEHFYFFVLFGRACGGRNLPSRRQTVARRPHRSKSEASSRNLPRSHPSKQDVNPRNLGRTTCRRVLEQPCHLARPSKSRRSAYRFRDSSENDPFSDTQIELHLPIPFPGTGPIRSSCNEMWSPCPATTEPSMEPCLSSFG